MDWGGGGKMGMLEWRGGVRVEGGGGYKESMLCCPDLIYILHPVWKSQSHGSSKGLFSRLSTLDSRLSTFDS